MNFVGIEADPLLLNIILPLGISFYTFQTISYTVDVYRGVIKPEKDFVIYGCYVTFFPQLVAGPILRAAEVIHQFAKRPPFDWANIAPLVDSGFAYRAAFILLYRLTVPWFANLSRTIQKFGGWLITLPIVMLGWIPFRAQNMTDTLAMYLKIFQPTEYLWLGLRENTYIIAAIILMGIILTYLTKTYLVPLLRQRIWLTIIAESLVFSVMIGLVFVFLRPINQFIYFQF
ncbi:hypothetical protein [Candidatus Marithrix sp. Canyon 246]|nr:hypothetical protein [Candidatus Marithrix sp. Canyon 246]